MSAASQPDPEPGSREDLKQRLVAQLRKELKANWTLPTYLFHLLCQALFALGIA